MRIRGTGRESRPDRNRRCRIEVVRQVSLAAPMPIRAWFPTFIYCEPLQKVGLARLNDELADECRRLRAFDAAGRRWSEKNYPGGYTRYASLNELPPFSSPFTHPQKKFTKHVRAFARKLAT